jgi:hypothetical protein
LTSGGVITTVTVFTFTVDVPDAVDKGMVLVPLAGLDIAFNRIFRDAPGISVLILDGVSNDDHKTTNLTKTGFTVFLNNGGTPISKYISWTAIGY